MKKLFTFTTSLLIAVMLFAQTPEKMNFQAVVRDNNNNLITNTIVGIRISILKNSMPVYVETQKPISNSNGLITIAFGGGAGFDAIDWANGPFFIKSEIDPTGSGNYTITGTSQLMSVPYAFHAQTARYLIGDNNQNLKSADPGIGAQTWSKFGNAKTDPLKDKLGTTDFTDMIFVTNNTERLRIKSDGNISMGNLAVDGNLAVKQSVFLNTAGGTTTVNGNLTVSNTKPTHLTGNLQVDGSANIKGTTSLEGKASMGGGADFTGPVEFKDDVAIAKNLTVGGTANITGRATMNVADLNGQVTINATVTGGESNYGAYPLRVQGSDQGIAIKVNNERDVTNNYVTFWDSKGVQGRIEGETTTNLLLNPEYMVDNALYAADIVLSGLDAGISTFEFIQAIADLAAACSSSTGCAGFGVVVCAPIPSLIAAAVTNLVVKTATLVVSAGNVIKSVADATAYNTFKHIQIGVTYQSGAGDYAEWLPKLNPTDDFDEGDIVGLKVGKVIANTADADKVMVVSTKPIVLGNMPEAGKEAEYEKIAFMGQVPALVTGPVNEGDYILPSGNNDGQGIAISPVKIKIDQFQKIVGTAWSALPAGTTGYVNVAVGLNANDVALYSIKQDLTIDSLKFSLTTIVDVLREFDPKLAAALKDVYIFPCDGGTNTNKVRKIKYFKPKEKDIDDAIVAAEIQLREELGKDSLGVDKIDKHPFFNDMKDSGKKKAFKDKVSLEFDKEVARKKEVNKSNGIETEVE